MDMELEKAVSKPSSREGARILVIDDEEIIHASLGRILSRLGHRVVGVRNGSVALKRLSAGQYDLVITDLMMPEMDGIQLLERMVADGLKVPVLMITGYPTIRTALRALRLGAIDYVAKPFTRNELLGPVKRALRRAPGRDPELGAMKTQVAADGIDAPETRIVPGERFCLRKHSWAVYQQDGSMKIGIEASFLDAVDSLTTIEPPSKDDLIEQGYVGFRLGTKANEEHRVFMPLSGQVVEVNNEALQHPSSIHADTWLVAIIPHRLEQELGLLSRC